MSLADPDDEIDISKPKPPAAPRGVRAPRPGLHPRPSQARAAVDFVQGALAKAVDETVDSLSKAEGIDVYVRGGRLVRPVVAAANPRTFAVREEPVVNITRPEGSVSLEELTPAALTEVLSRCVDFQKYDGRRKAPITINPPPEIARTIIDRRGYGLGAMPALRAVITCPTLRPDGSVLSEPGFDPATGLLLISDRQWCQVPYRPVLKDARVAAETLFQPLRGLPFVERSDRAAAIAMLITAVLRPNLPVSPMYAISAPAAGTGKTLCADVAAIMATGRPACVVAPTPDEAEFEKRLGASAMAGDQVICIDNVTHALRSDALCQILTQEEVAVRILGKSENVKISSTALIVATGNNLSLYGDLNRRAIRVNLDAHSERPDERSFSWDPRSYTRQKRPELVAAALTLVRAYILAGRPNPAPPMGSFEAWSDYVRSAMLWAGEADCRGKSDEFRAEDPEKVMIAEVIDILPSAGTWTVRSVREMVSSDPNVRAGLSAFLDRNGTLSGPKFSGFLRRYKDRPVGGRAIKLHSLDEKHGSTWYIGGERGNVGFS